MRDLNEPYYGIEEPQEPDDGVGVCPECGAVLYDGDRIYYGRGCDHIIGCEHCIDVGFAGGGAA